MANRHNISNGTLRIVFWNARSINKRINELPTLLQNIDIFMCVESWLTPEDDFRIPGYISFRKDRLHSKGGGILILIKQNLAFYEIKNIKTPHSTVEMCGLRISNIHPPIDLYACYR